MLLRAFKKERLDPASLTCSSVAKFSSQKQVMTNGIKMYVKNVIKGLGCWYSTLNFLLFQWCYLNFFLMSIIHFSWYDQIAWQNNLKVMF